SYHQPLMLLHSLAGRSFEDVSTLGGAAFHRRYSARGLATGDLNNDGYPDVVFTENGGPPHILMNNCEHHNHWLGLVLQSRIANPSATGATIRWSAGGHTFKRLRIA